MIIISFGSLSIDEVHNKYLTATLLYAVNVVSNTQNVP